jgi:hypothetical protein
MLRRIRVVKARDVEVCDGRQGGEGGAGNEKVMREGELGKGRRLGECARRVSDVVEANIGKNQREWQ